MRQYLKDNMHIAVKGRMCSHSFSLIETIIKNITFIPKSKLSVHTANIGGPGAYETDCGLQIRGHEGLDYKSISTPDQRRYTCDTFGIVLPGCNFYKRVMSSASSLL